MGIADLPDIDEDEWLAYQADTFRRATDPIAASAAFRASTEPLIQTFDTKRVELETPFPEPPPPRADRMVPLPEQLMGGPQAGGGPQFDGMGSQPYFGGQQSDTTSLFDELTSFDGDGEMPAYKAAMQPMQDGLAGMGQAMGQAWQGDPKKPGFFSWAGEQVGKLTDQARNQGLTQNNPLGTALVGAGEAVEGTLHGLGGSAQALREGNVLGGVAGTASAALNAVGDIPRGIATEGQWPTQILPGISPETPVIGGLNNPRELAGLATDLLIPETAIERMAGRAIGKVAKPALSAAGTALERAGAGEAGGLVAGADRLRSHGSARLYDRPDPGRFDPHGVDGPAYYTTSEPRVAQTYTDYVRGQGQADPAIQPNVRNLQVSEGTRLLDTDNPVPPQEMQMLRSYLEGKTFSDSGVGGAQVEMNRFLDEWSERTRQHRVNKGSQATELTGYDLYTALTRMGRRSGSKEIKRFANEVLSAAGFDGVTHRGGLKHPAYDEAGNLIEHQVDAIFPDKLNRVRNTSTGMMEGLVSGIRPIGAPGRGLTAAQNRDLSEFPEGLPGSMRPEFSESSDVFYSKLEQAIDKLPARATADQMRKTLLAQGVKPEEMQWSGVNELLDSYRPGEQVPIHEIRNTHQLNRVDVREVVRGTEAPPGDPLEIAEYTNQAAVLEQRMSMVESERERLRQAAPTYTEQEWEQAVARMAELDAEEASIREKHSEVIDQLDVLEGVGEGVNADAATQPQFMGTTQGLPMDETYREFEFTVKPTGQIPLQKGGTHWPEENVVAHARTFDHVLPDGKRLLVLAEAQSDIHQRGRRIGYKDKDSYKVEDPDGALQAAKDEAYRIASAGDEVALEQWAGGDAHKLAIARDQWVVAMRDKQHQAIVEFQEITDDLANRGIASTDYQTNHPLKEAAWQRIQEMDAAVSDAVKRSDVAWQTARTQPQEMPFSKTWDELVMKRMMRLAANEGYDGLAWVDAAFQGDVNNIGRQVLQIAYSPKQRKLAVVYDDGAEHVAEKVFPESLPEMIGRPLSRALLDTEPLDAEKTVVSYATGLSGPIKVIGGTDLERLGDTTEQFKFFYDTRLKQIADKLGKPFGAKTQENAWAIDAPDTSTGYMNLHGIEITDQMIQSLASGEKGSFPLFINQARGRDFAERAMTSPFFSPARTGQEAAGDIALGTAGGIAGAATAEEDATWQERGGRFLAGAAAGAGIGPTTRANMRRLGRLAADETGGGPLPSGIRQGIPDFGGRRPPISPEEWEVMTPRQRRNARDAADAGRTYTPLPRDEINRRAALRESQRIQEEIRGEEPDLAPLDATDELPPAEASGDVLSRVLSEMTPAGKAAAESWERTAARFNAGWMRGFVRASEEAPWEGGQRYDRILELASGEKATGEQVGRAMAEAEDVAAYEPPKKLTRREKERLGNLRSMQAALTDEEQALAEKLRDQAIADMRQYHGFRTEEESKQAADNLLPFLLQFARNAQPNEPVSESLMLAGRQARAHATALANYAELDWHKAIADPNSTEEAVQIAKQARDYWMAAAQVFARYGGEVAPSESGRTFRSMRTSPEPLIPTVAGGSGEVPTNRGRIVGKEKEFMEMLQSRRKLNRGELESLSGGERVSRRAVARRAGKRPGGDLDVLGIEWSDVMKRTGDDDADRVKMMAGLGDLGGYRMRRDWTPRLMKLDLDDKAAVEAFWKEARAAAGVDEKGLPYVKFDPNVEGQSYLGGRETITRSQAIGMLSKELIKDVDEATRAVREARAEQALPADIADLEEKARNAYQRLGLNIDEWPEDSFPVVTRIANSVRERIEREWPKDRPKGSTAMEEVEKKRQLLALFDQELKKENPAATVAQDVLSFGTSNVLSTPRFVQSSILESALSSINEPFQDVLRGNYAAAGQRVAGLARAFGLGNSEDLVKLGEGIKAPALVNAMKGFRDIGPMESATGLREVAGKGAGLIRSDSANPMMKWLAPMHRVSRGISEAFQTANYFGEVNRLVHEASEKGSLPGGFKIEQIMDDELGRLRNPTPQELFGNLPQEIVDEALKTSKRITEGGAPDWIEKKLGETKGLLSKPNASGWERTVGLFTNLMSPFVYGLRPMIRSGTKTLFSAPIHGTEAARALLRGDTEGAKYAGKKFALANAFNAFIAYQVMAGNITGHGPSDPATRQSLMEATDENGDPVWRPDSMRIRGKDGNFWVKYTSLPGPVSIVATVMGNMYDAYAFEGKDMETAPETAARMAQQLLPSILDNTYFRDFINLSEAMNANGGGIEMGRIAGQIAGRFVPGAGALRLGATLTDPYQRLTENPLQDIQSGIPGLRQQLPAQVSAYTGEPVEQGLAPITALGGLSGNVYSSPSEPNPMAREVAELRRRPIGAEGAVGAPTPRTFTRGEQARGGEFMGQRQTGEALRGAQGEFGREAGRQLLPVIMSPEYQALTPEQKAARLEQVIGQSGSARPAAEYAASGRVELPPQRALERRMSEQPQFMGVSGSPQEIAAMNQRIKTARDSLAQLSSRYGKSMAMALMAQQSPEALQLAVSYPPMNRDLLWMIEQREAQNMGITPEESEATLIPDFGGGARSVQAPAGALQRNLLPPSARRSLG